VGFIREKRYKLKFEGEFDGFQVTARPVSIGEYLELLATWDDTEALEKMSKEELQAWVQLFCGQLANVIVSWNLETKDRRAIPVTAENLAKQDHELLFSIMRGYMQAVTGREVAQADPTLEASLPMTSIPSELVS
jgi:homoserine trans-succinylase